MTRYFAWWLVLTVTLVPVTLATSILVFRHFDLRYTYILQLMVIPALQALVLAWWTAPTHPRRSLRLWTTLWSDPLVRILLVLDTVLILTGWIAHEHHVLGLAGGANLHPTWIGTKSIVAALVLLGAVLYARGRHPARERAWIGLLGIVALGSGLQAFRPWLSDIGVLALGGQSALIRAVTVYGMVFGTGILVALRVAHVIRPIQPAASRLTEWATAPAFVGMIIMTLNGYLRGYAIEPWASLLLTSASISASCVLAAALLLVGGPTSAEGRTP